MVRPHLSPSTFPAEWVRKGSDDYGWYVLEGRVSLD